VITYLDLNAIFPFGSFAKGDINEGSDVDIVVVADFEQGFLDMIKVLLDLNVGLPLEPVGYTPEEFTRMQMEGNPFILELLEKGRILYERAQGW
jgi:hypothetical protein